MQPTAEPSVPSSAAEEVLESLLDEMAERLQRGAAVDVEDYAARYPQHAEQLRQMLPAMRLLAGVGRVLADGDTGSDSGPDSPCGTLGDFRILREVGRGGMGVVYEAIQTSLNRRVALKVLPFAATMDPRHLQRFRNEAQAAASLHHPHIVPVHAVGCERGVHYYAMQFIDGQTLAEFIRDHKPTASPPTAPHPRAEGEPATPDQRAEPGQSPGNKADVPAAVTRTESAVRQSTQRSNQDKAYFANVARLGIQAAEALECAHTLGIVHRDVKPANLMLDGQGQLWITDFGLARTAADSSLTMSGDVVGTLRYMSPEQALAKHGLVDHRTDIYALGVTLYELLTLQPAVDGKDRQEILHKIANEEPVAQRKLNRLIPADLETVVLKAMSKEPQTRYGTARELAEDLRRFLEDRPVHAKWPTVRQRVVRWTRRHKYLTWSVSAVLVVLALAVVSSIGWALWDQSLRQRTTEQLVGQIWVDMEKLHQRKDWFKARELALRAQALLRTMGGAPEWHDQVAARLRDLDMAIKLEEIRLQEADIEENKYAFVRAQKNYRTAFQKYGIPIDELTPEEAAQRIQSCSIEVELVAALDDWAYIQRHRLKDPGWQRLVNIARLADRDDWRNQVRDALAQEDWKRLMALADSPKAVASPAATLISLSRGLERGKAIERAVALLRQAHLLHPDDLWINFELAWQLMRLQPAPLEEAIGYYRAALVSRPNSPALYLHLGLALHQKGNLEGEIKHYRKALDIDPNFAAAHNNLGESLRAKGDLEGAIKHYRKSLELDPNSAPTHNSMGNALRIKNDLQGAINHFRQATQIDSQNALAHTNLAISLYYEKDLDGAINHYRKALAIDPKNSQAHANLGVILYLKNDLEGALEHLHRALEIDPNDDVAQGAMANALADNKDLDGALRYYTKALRLKPHSAETHYNLATVLKKMNNLDGAFQHYTTALQLDPKSALAHNKLAFALYSRKDFDGASYHWTKVTELDPSNADAHNNLGEALKAKKELDRAIEHYTKALELNPNLALARNNLCLAVLDRKELDGDSKHLAKAVQIAANYADAHYNLGHHLYEKKDLDGAIQRYRKVLELDPNYAEAHCNLGIALRDQGLFAEALNHLQLGHELGSQRSGWCHSSAQWLQECDQLLKADQRLQIVLRGQGQAQNPQEMLCLANLCQRHKKHFAAAAQFYAEAFATQPQLAENLEKHHRYNAACAAALAGTGQGNDAAKLTDQEKAACRTRAFGWLGADLKIWANILKEGSLLQRPAAVERLRHWQTNTDLAGVRDADALAKLSGRELRQWRQFWSEVRDLLQEVDKPTRSPTGTPGVSGLVPLGK